MKVVGTQMIKVDIITEISNFCNELLKDINEAIVLVEDKDFNDLVGSSYRMARSKTIKMIAWHRETSMPTEAQLETCTRLLFTLTEAIQGPNRGNQQVILKHSRVMYEL